MKKRSDFGWEILGSGFGWVVLKWVERLGRGLRL